MNDNIIGGVSPLKKKLLISGGKQYRGGTKTKVKGTKGKRGGGYGKSTSKVNPQGYTKNTRFRIPDKMQFPPGGGKTKPTTPTPPVTIGKDGLPEINFDFADMFGDFNLSNTMGSMTMGDMTNTVSNDNTLNSNIASSIGGSEEETTTTPGWTEYKEINKVYEGHERACHEDRKKQHFTNSAGVVDQAGFDAECNKYKKHKASKDYKPSNRKETKEIYHPGTSTTTKKKTKARDINQKITN
tara:strand:+ start:955 stop:1677 length:723 start_codon:yes stop_codon:yes gene_type:complete